MTIRHPLAVWAPKPERVRVRVQGADHDLVRGDDGWWAPAEGELTDIAPDAEYGYLLGDDDRVAARPAVPSPAATACTRPRSASTRPSTAGRTTRGPAGRSPAA